MEGHFAVPGVPPDEEQTLVGMGGTGGRVFCS